MKLSLNTPAIFVCVLGLGLLMLGLGLDRHFGGVKLLQQVDSPGVFTLAIILAGPQLKWASWADILLIVPGYTLLFAGLLMWLRRRLGDRFRRSRVAVKCVLAAAALSDQYENLMVQIGLRQCGAYDPKVAGTPFLREPEAWIVTGMNAASWSKWVFLVATVVGIIGLWIASLMNRPSTPHTGANRTW